MELTDLFDFLFAVGALSRQISDRPCGGVVAKFNAIFSCVEDSGAEMFLSLAFL